MEQELLFIQNQLWAVLGLFLILIVMNIICYFTRKTEKSDEPDFGKMWDKGQFDEIINKTNEHLSAFPNHCGALYFGAKALIIKNQNINEAERRLNILIKSEPTLKDSVQELLDEINKTESS